MRRFHDWLLGAATVVIAICAIVLTGFNVQARYATARAPDPAFIVENWQFYAQAGHRLGAAKPRVTAVVFMDYECAACNQAALDFERLRARYPELAIVIRHFPLPGNSRGDLAARIAICADGAGRFGAMHNKLLVDLDRLSPETIAPFATAAGVDGTALQGCVDRPETAHQLDADIAAARRLDIRGVPMLLVNGELYTGSTGIKAIIRKHIARSRKQVAPASALQSP